MSRLGWIACIAGLVVLGFTEGVSTQAGRAGPGHLQSSAPTTARFTSSRFATTSPCWSVRGGNITVSAGNDGVLMVDGGTAAMADKVLAAVRTISAGPIRYLVNTNERGGLQRREREDRGRGETIPFRPNQTIQIQGYIGTNRATVVSYLSVYERMSAPTGKVAPRAEGAWPDATYSTPQKKLHFNDEPVLIMHQPSATDGNSIVHFRRADVVSVGDLIDLTGYPVIDLAAGGSIQSMLDGPERSDRHHRSREAIRRRNAGHPGPRPDRGPARRRLLLRDAEHHPRPRPGHDRARADAAAGAGRAAHARLRYALRQEHRRLDDRAVRRGRLSEPEEVAGEGDLT